MTILDSRALTTLMLLASVALISSSSLVHARKIVCWKNNEGVRECGNAVPPQYAQGKVERKSSTGLTVEKTERAKTKEELDATRVERERLAKEKAEQDRLAAVQARKDRVLLHTFATEEDLKLARDGKLAAIDSRIKHSEQRVAKSEAMRADMQSEAAQIERGGKKVPEDLSQKIDDIQGQITSTLALIARRRNEKVDVQEQFELDLVRYRELKKP